MPLQVQNVQLDTRTQSALLSERQPIGSTGKHDESHRANAAWIGNSKAFKERTHRHHQTLDQPVRKRHQEVDDKKENKKRARVTGVLLCRWARPSQQTDIISYKRLPARAAKGLYVLTDLRILTEVFLGPEASTVACLSPCPSRMELRLL